MASCCPRRVFVIGWFLESLFPIILTVRLRAVHISFLCGEHGADDHNTQADKRDKKHNFFKNNINNNG